MKPKALLVAALAVATSCGDGEAKNGHEVATSGTLTLLRERNLAELLPPAEHYEASGIALANGSLRVVFDNSTRVAQVDLALSTAALGPGSESASQYEGIAIATRSEAKTYVVKEGAGSQSAIVTLDEQGRLLSTEPTDLAFAAGNKGIEGIAWLDDIDRMLVLCEANSCGAGDSSRGHGLIKSVRREAGSWRTETTLALPALADFDDYSDLAVLADDDGSYHVAVVSQQAAALWLGVLTTRPLALRLPGVVYGFPKAGGKTQYCSLEGVTFLDKATFALASDHSKNSGGCTKAEAIHVFAIE
ncbi:MAG: hypothetical protein JWP87_5418 [Labilithrix sp.]|nr:hypothetical protein [Labilithrix sp.]